MEGQDIDGVPRCRELLRAATRIVALTGTGLSAASGLPSFRLTNAAYRANAGPVWDWYMLRREAVTAARPNKGHAALARLQAARRGAMTILTQAVDDLHERAGCQGVLALQGRITEERWLDPARPCCLSNPPVPGSPPRCGSCGNLRRPAITWTDELPCPAKRDAAAAALASADLLLVAGERCVVPPAAELVSGFARAGGCIAVLGEEPSDVDGAAAVVLRGSPAELLSQVVD